MVSWGSEHWPRKLLLMMLVVVIVVVANIRTSHFPPSSSGHVNVYIIFDICLLCILLWMPSPIERSGILEKASFAVEKC